MKNMSIEISKHSHVVVFSGSYDTIYSNDDFFQQRSHMGQFMIVDSGCPRSLMGLKEYEKLKQEYETEVLNLKEHEKFRFGPSKSYTSGSKVRVPMRIGDSEFCVDFFTVDANIPILIGNDFLKPMGGSINIGEKQLEIKKLDKMIKMIETPGGHFVIPVKHAVIEKATNKKINAAKEYHENILGEEADAIMIILMVESEDEDALQLFHDEVGHSTFLSLALNQEEKDQVDKVHRYFGHRSGRRIWDLFAKAKRMKGKRQQVLEIIGNCKVCSHHKKAPPRPKVGLPSANDFNEVIGIDLKVLNKEKGEYILWMVDLFSKLIKGKFIKNKKPATIIQAIIDSWIVGDGAGPGHPSRGFWSDNGGEFLNDEMINFAATCDLNIKMSAAESPWQNGIVERHHATADIVYEKIMLENPAMSPQDAVNQASFSKNSDINRSGFSPLQLMMGKSPGFPGLAEANPASSNIDSANKYMKTLKNIDQARIKFRETECDTKLKKAIGEKINPNVERFYNIGDPVFFYDQKKKHWKKATALIRLGKTVYLKFGNYLRRVAVDNVRPDRHGEEVIEEGYVEPDPDNERFAEVETPVKEMERDLELAEKNRKLTEKVKELTNDVNEKQEMLERHEKEKQKNVLNEKDADDKKDDTGRDKVVENRNLKRTRQKENKEKENEKYPKLGHDILFREKESESWKSGRVVKTFKKTSKHKTLRHLDVEDEGRVQFDFDKDIAEWKENPGNEELVDTIEDDLLIAGDILTGEDDSIDAFPVKIVPRKDYNKPEIQAAMSSEISKFEKFEAFEEVNDQGQNRIPIRWVVTEKKDDGKNQPFKARLCMRGDLEQGKEQVRADSPTASKETLKLALIIAANEGFKVKSIDIKSAFLQGKALDRKIFVKPPTEANREGKLWLLLQAAYGILDGGRMFYLKLSETLESLGLHRVHADGALFTYVKDGKLHGLVASHVDDLLITGDDVFKHEVEEKLQETFIFSKIEEGCFKYCGCRISAKEDGSIELDQNEYVKVLEKIPEMEGSLDRILTEKERKAVRAKIGEILWISLMTRPDLSYDVNVISSQVTNATVATVMEMNRIVTKAKNGKKNILKFVKLGDISDLIVKVYADASFGNRDDGTRSTGGRIVLIENKRKNAVNISCWKTKKIARVCRSVKAAETRALEEAIDEAVNTARVVKEVYTGKINLKNPDQIPVEALTDSKSLWESIHNSRQCEEKMLRNCIANIKEMKQLGYVNTVSWVPTDKQLADCMTKRNKKADWLLSVASSNKL